MPIDYEYGNPIFVGLAAGQVGQALDQRAQEQIDFDRMLKLNQAGLQQQQLDEQARQFDVAKIIEQNMANLQADRARQQQGLQFSLNRADAAQKQTNDWRDFQQQMALNQANRLGQMEHLGYQNQLKSLAGAEEDQRQWMMDAGEQANESAKTTLSEFQKLNLSPEGQQIRAQWRAKIDAYRAKQGELRPQTYAKGMAELLEGMGKAGIEDFEQQDMTPEESLKQSSLPLDKNNVWTRKADGSWVVNKLQPEPKGEKEKEVDPAKELVDTPYGRPMTAKEYETRYRTDYADAERRILARKKEKAGEDVAPGTVFIATAEEINEEINKFNEAATAFREGRKAGELPPPPFVGVPEMGQDPYSDPKLAMAPPPFVGTPAIGGQPPAAPPQQDPMTAPPSMVEQQMAEPNSIDPGFYLGGKGENVDPGFALPSQGGDVDPGFNLSNRPPAPPQAPTPQVTAPPPRYAMPTMKPEAAAANPDVKGYFKWLDKVFYKPLTPEELINLPAGTELVLPDGRTGTKK